MAVAQQQYSYALWADGLPGINPWHLSLKSLGWNVLGKLSLCTHALESYCHSELKLDLGRTMD